MKYGYRSIDEYFENNGYFFIKPPINIDNYFLLWDKKSLGINSSSSNSNITTGSRGETNSLKIFIRNTIPALEFIMNLFKIDSKNSTLLKKIIIDKGKFSVVYKFNEQVSFILQIDNIGQTILYREEKICIDKYDQMHLQSDINNINNNKELLNINYNIIIKWKLGELLFNRHKIGNNA